MKYFRDILCANWYSLFQEQLGIFWSMGETNRVATADIIVPSSGHDGYLGVKQNS